MEIAEQLLDLWLFGALARYPDGEEHVESAVEVRGGVVVFWVFVVDLDGVAGERNCCFAVTS